jgi:hypothetical protein
MSVPVLVLYDTLFVESDILRAVVKPTGGWKEILHIPRRRMEVSNSA